MAYASSTTANPGRLGLRARYGRILEKLAEQAAGRKAYQRTVTELQALSDRDLADFGIHRSEIPRIARQATGRA